MKKIAPYLWTAFGRQQIPNGMNNAKPFRQWAKWNRGYSNGNVISLIDATGVSYNNLAGWIFCERPYRDGPMHLPQHGENWKSRGMCRLFRRRPLELCCWGLFGVGSDPVSNQLQWKNYESRPKLVTFGWQCFSSKDQNSEFQTHFSDGSIKMCLTKMHSSRLKPSINEKNKSKQLETCWLGKDSHTAKKFWGGVNWTTKTWLQYWWKED